MNAFGAALRSFRQASNDPDRHNRRLSQQRLGELIGQEIGDLGFSGAAISDWERGESMINAADRNVLLALIQVLYKNKGLFTLEEANRFLECGNFRILNEQESTGIFGNHFRESNAAQLGSASKISQSDGLLLLTSMFSVSKEEVDEVLATAKEGPTPSWPRILAALMRKVSDRFSFSLNTVLWIWIWLFTWWLIGASLRLPYANRELAFRALTMYAAGSVIIPLLIGLLVNTKDNKFWKEQNQRKTTLLRLYTYQGSGIGFNIGYFLVFPIALIRYYFHLAPAVWVEILAVTVSLILGNMGTRVVPYNLWRAYGRLTIQDGAIFFAVAFIGLFWGFFFFQYYSLFLTPVWGTLVILSALTIAIIVMTRDARKQNSQAKR